MAKFTLVNKWGKAVEEGSSIKSKWRRLYSVVGGKPPQNEYDCGRIFVLNDGETQHLEFMPSDFNCKWIEV